MTSSDRDTADPMNAGNADGAPRRCSTAFVALQFAFARRVCAVSGLALERALGEYTNLYVRLAMGDRLDPANPRWQAYLAGLSAAHDPIAWTAPQTSAGPPVPSADTEESVGCFRMVSHGPDQCRLHFQPRGDEPGSALSAAHVRRRRAELATLARRQADRHSANMHVVGASWLYNLPAYRRLFPAAYLAGLAPMPHPYQRMPLWGQFLDRQGDVRRPGADRFLASIAAAETLSALADCFAFGVLTTSAPLRVWFDANPSDFER